jgi:hypothetical protein
MAAFNKFNAFVENLAEKVHDLGADTLKIMLTNTAPAATNALLSDITEIAAGNGYSAGGSQATQSASSQTSGTYKLVCADVTFTASGGSIGPFRYAVLYNDTPASPLNPLIGWWDYGTNVTLTDGNAFTVDLSAANGVLQLV